MNTKLYSQMEKSYCIGNGQVNDAMKPDEELSKTLNCMDDPMKVLVIENHPNDSRVKIKQDNVFQTLSGRMGTGGGNVPMIMEDVQSLETYHCTTEEGKVHTLKARDYKDPQCVSEGHNVVRRLTPLECERLQGFPDGWTDIGDWYDSNGVKHKGESDSPRYKALGNSIALPFWEWMLKRMMEHLGEEPTMASLFDGIGGFPLIWERNGGKAVWASEIEEFPIAVTKIHFKENEDENKRNAENND